jgi:hypothetical protein
VRCVVENAMGCSTDGSSGQVASLVSSWLTGTHSCVDWKLQEVGRCKAYFVSIIVCVLAAFHSVWLRPFLSMDFFEMVRMNIKHVCPKVPIVLATLDIGM